MGVKHTTKKNLIPHMVVKAQALDGKKVEVGVFDGDHAWLAGIHEYGCRIPVTPKMRAFLNYNGIHLKEDTTEIVIPERSFLRSGFDACHEEVIGNFEKLLSDYLVQQLIYTSQKALNTNDIVPYNNEGISILENAAVSVMSDAASKGMIAKTDTNAYAYEVDYPAISYVPEEDITNRTYRLGSVSFTVQGAIDKVEITVDMTM